MSSYQEKKRQRAAAAIAASATLVLSACGSAGTGGNEDAQEPAEEAHGTLADTCQAADSEDTPVLWYESSLPEQINQVISAFNEEYPDVQVDYQRVEGGNGTPAQIIQETNGGVETADIATITMEQVAQLNERDLIDDFDMDELGITDEQLMPAQHAVAIASTLPAIVYNTDLLEADEVPSTWDEVIDPKWAGTIRGYSRNGPLLASLVEEWGEERTDEHVESFTDLDPVLDASTYGLADNVGAGVSPLGFGLYHTAAQTEANGAPIDWKIPDPVTVSPASMVITKTSTSPLSAKCLTGWLATEDGAKAYEDATLRGNHLIEGTEAHSLVDDKTVALFPFSEIDEVVRLTEKYNAMLAEAE